MGLLLSGILFVGLHFLMSHPLRAPLVKAMGEKKFKGLYSLVALVTFGGMIYFYRVIGDEPPLWKAPDWVWIVGALLMWFAAILLVGSFRNNPAMKGKELGTTAASGVFTITRHPFMWAVAIWAAVHWAVIATPKAMVLDIPLIILALGGAALQDRKKEKLAGDDWYEWEAKTSYLPFGRGSGNPGLFSFVGGTLLTLLATWLHPIPVGLWRFIG